MLHTFFITASLRGKLRVVRAFDPPAGPHYVARASNEDRALKLVRGYRVGEYWAAKEALAGNICIAGH